MLPFKIQIAATLFFSTGCFFDGELKIRTPTVPSALDDGWEIATPEEVGLSKDALASIHNELLREDANFGTLSFLVVKDGKLVFETFLRSTEDRDHYNHIQSVTKSVTSLLFGAARDRGLFPSLDERLTDLFPEETQGLDEKKKNITLAQLMTMRSGISFDNDYFSYEMFVERPRNPLRYILDKPLYADPGARFYYRDADPQLIGYAIQKRTGSSEQEFADEVLFAPLGIEDYYWESGSDGASLGAHGLHLRPRDLAKIGLLALEDGVWRGARIISKEWCERSMREQTLSEHKTFDGSFLPYGHYWWIIPNTGFLAAGHGGQFVLVVPEKDMVIVQTARPDSDDLHGGVIEDFLTLVEPLL